mmetsp:Transcript_117348/g.203915  ORF Transcript_117348/g.203915 Transcript_117348/m.203915 type:complete len:376 (-) Transcript_117348:54-1181(-)
MGGALFTLELIADGLCGPLGSLMAALAKPAAAAAAGGVSAADAALGIGRPALGLRLIDLAPVLIEAPVDASFGVSASSRVKFGGRGKALAFELPSMPGDNLQTGPPATSAMPLWLLALAKQPGTETSVLLASACVDLRGEIARAAADRCSGEAAACPFRRCAFRMTAVRDAGCALTLECYLRVYAGEQRPVTGGELLLEPSAVSVGIFGDHPVHEPPVREQRCAETQTEEPECPEEAPTAERSPSAQRGSAGATSAAGVTPIQEEVQRPRASQGGRNAFFAEEITVQNPPGRGARRASAEVRSVARAAEVRTGLGRTADTVHATSPNVAVAGAPLDDDGHGADRIQASPASPEVSSSLPLVSELVRELFQIREIK